MIKSWGRWSCKTNKWMQTSRTFQCVYLELQPFWPTQKVLSCFHQHQWACLMKLWTADSSFIRSTWSKALMELSYLEFSSSYKHVCRIMDHGIESIMNFEAAGTSRSWTYKELWVRKRSANFIASCGCACTRAIIFCTFGSSDHLPWRSSWFRSVSWMFTTNGELLCIQSLRCVTCLDGFMSGSFTSAPTASSSCCFNTDLTGVAFLYMAYKTSCTIPDNAPRPFGTWFTQKLH